MTDKMILILRFHYLKMLLIKIWDFIFRGLYNIGKFTDHLLTRTHTIGKRAWSGYKRLWLACNKQWFRIIILGCVILGLILQFSHSPTRHMPCYTRKQVVSTNRGCNSEFQNNLPPNYAQKRNQVNILNSNGKPFQIKLLNTDEDGRIVPESDSKIKAPGFGNDMAIEKENISEIYKREMSLDSLDSDQKGLDGNFIEKQNNGELFNESAVDLQKFIGQLTGHSPHVLQYRIRPADIPSNVHFPNNSLCEQYQEDWKRYWPVMKNIFQAYITNHSAVTMVTQISADRFTAFETLLQFWSGPVSTALYGNY